MQKAFFLELIRYAMPKALLGNFRFIWYFLQERVSECGQKKPKPKQNTTPNGETLFSLIFPYLQRESFFWAVNSKLYYIKDYGCVSIRVPQVKIIFYVILFAICDNGNSSPCAFQTAEGPVFNFRPSLYIDILMKYQNAALTSCFPSCQHVSFHL